MKNNPISAFLIIQSPLQRRARAGRRGNEKTVSKMTRVYALHQWLERT
jgi:hypothetical protein